MRGTQMARQWKIIRLLEARIHGISGNDLATEFDVSLRTIYRDLEALQEAGFPLYTEKEGKNSVWKLLEPFRKNFPLPLTAAELMALNLSRELLGIFEGTIYREGIETLFQKVKSTQLPETLSCLESITRTLKNNFVAMNDFASLKGSVKGLSDTTGPRKGVGINSALLRHDYRTPLKKEMSAA